jgi:hypothetical protein
MRSMTFDMVGMALMALGVILTSGGMLVWGYVADTRSPRNRRAGPSGTRSEDAAEPPPRVSSHR